MFSTKLTKNQHDIGFALLKKLRMLNIKKKVVHCEFGQPYIFDNLIFLVILYLGYYHRLIFGSSIKKHPSTTKTLFEALIRCFSICACIFLNNISLN